VVEVVVGVEVGVVVGVGVGMMLIPARSHSQDVLTIVIDRVARQHYGLTSRQIRSAQRYRDISSARAAISWVCCELGYSLCAVGRELHKHHTTVLAAKRRAESAAVKDVKIREFLVTLLNEARGVHELRAKDQPLQETDRIG
jgi:chromosomal replication initiation ATPase DnaA